MSMNQEINSTNIIISTLTTDHRKFMTVVNTVLGFTVSPCKSHVALGTDDRRLTQGDSHLC
jgi:hypothetical protein